MVIGPKELLESRSKEEDELLSRLEKEIDEYLSRKFDGAPVTYTLDRDCVNIRNNLISGLLKRYRKAGWSVEMEYSIRDDETYIYFDYEPARLPRRKKR